MLEGASKECVPCKAEGCVDCTVQDPADCDLLDVDQVCYACDDGFLLHLDAECVISCPAGYQSDFWETRCEPAKAGVFWFPLTQLSLLFIAVALTGQCSAKNVTGEHKRLLSFYALMGVLDTLSIWLLLFFCLLQGTFEMVVVPVLALLGTYYLNYLYRGLWDELDPPKPEDEARLSKSEALLINKCDENFDRWATKYADIAQRLKFLVTYVNHKLFAVPFTHFYGYRHFTLRT